MFLSRNSWGAGEQPQNNNHSNAQHSAPQSVERKRGNLQVKRGARTG
ncbi:hypothetical protein [Devosia sp. DBB001]|nr:hypothetical protein [Devosia sp. DBB001]